jgi:translation initiation factor IF-3
VQTRMKKAKKELSRGNKVRVVLQFKGREKGSMEQAADKVFNAFYDHVSKIAVWEQKPQKVGELRMLAYYAPKSSQPQEATDESAVETEVTDGRAAC